MPDAHLLLLFVATSLALLVTPGPAVLYIVGRSVQQGVAAGLVSTLGLTCGGLVHVLGAVFGLSALLASSATAFRAVQWAGAAYLIYLGVKTWLERDAAERAETGGVPELGARASLRRVFADGFVVNVLNPKAALFFMALLPQFTDPAAGSVRVQLLVLGLFFLVLGLLTDSVYAVAAGSLGRWLEARPAAARRGRRIVGTTYIGLGLAAALGGRRG